MKKLLFFVFLLLLSLFNYSYANELSSVPKKTQHYYPKNIFSIDDIENLINACPTLKQSYRNNGKNHIERGSSIYGVILGMCRSNRTTCYKDIISKASEIYTSLGYKDVADKLMDEIYNSCAEKKIGTKPYNSCFMRLLKNKAKKYP